MDDTKQRKLDAAIQRATERFHAELRTHDAQTHRLEHSAIVASIAMAGITAVAVGLTIATLASVTTV
jgi:hypothetical protein